MNYSRILFTPDGNPITPDKIREKIVQFEDSYKNTTQQIIEYSKKLDKDGKTFVKCSSLILSNFGMTRSGPFKKDEKVGERLLKCWNVVGASLIDIKHSIVESGRSRDRFLLESEQIQREKIITEVWLIMKQLLPFTMGQTTFGLVGASKILFSVLPEIVLPIDNIQWLRVFKTVDIGDVIRGMVFDIQRWENATGKHLNEMDSSKRLTTLPSVYNVMAMAARAKYK
ncbi:MAG: hypothetical protein Q7R50_03250 [Dehalococcoidales bacterium]|nr:hypothetical protein [Dehalococcoidales bacterium]